MTEAVPGHHLALHPLEEERRQGALARDPEVVVNQTRTLPLQVHLVERESETTADVTLTLDSGEQLRGQGSSHRHPRDPDVPEIGDELATARALSELSHRLVVAAADSISRREHRDVHLTG